jgi:hypothetical protein
MKNKVFLTFIFALLLFASEAQNIRHDQLQAPQAETSDSLIFYMHDSEGYWRLGKGILDTSMVRYIEAYATIEQLNDSVVVLRGEIPTLLTDLDSAGFKITESQISDLQDYLTGSDTLSLREDINTNLGKDTTGIYHINRALLDAVDESDTTRWGEKATTYWEEVNDTIHPTKYPIRIDTMTMGDGNLIESDHIFVAARKTPFDYKRYYSSGGGTNVTMDTTIMDMCYSETGEYQYKVSGIISSNGETMNIYKSTDYGQTWDSIYYITPVNTNDSYISIDCGDLGERIGCVYYEYDSGGSDVVYLYSTNMGISFSKTYFNTLTFTQRDTRSIVLSRNGVYGGIMNGAASKGGELYYMNEDVVTYVGETDSDPGTAGAHLDVDNDGNLYYYDITQASYMKYDGSSTASLGSTALGDLSNSIVISGSIMYAAAGSQVEKSIDGGVTWDVIYTDTRTIYSLFISDDNSTMYILTAGGTSSEKYFKKSVDGGSTFTTMQSFTDDSNLYAQIKGNIGLGYSDVNIEFNNGYMQVVKGGITTNNNYTPENPNDLVTLNYFEANAGTGGGGTGDITAVLTGANSLLEGGTTSGTADLKLNIDNADYSSTVGSSDRWAVSRGGTEYYTTTGVLENYMQNNLDFGSSGLPPDPSSPSFLFNDGTGSSWLARDYNLALDIKKNSETYGDWVNLGSRGSLNFIEGTNITITKSISGTGNVELTFDAASGGGDMVYPAEGIAYSTGSQWGTSLTKPSGDIVGTTESQSLTSKTVNGVNLTTNGDGTYFLANDGTYKVVSSGSGATNLSTSYGSTSVTINSDTGNDATVNSATTSNAGVMSSSDKTKLDGLAITGSTTQNFSAQQITLPSNWVISVVNGNLQFSNGTVNMTIDGTTGEVSANDFNAN